LNGEFVRFLTHLFVSGLAGKEQVSKAMKGEKAGGIFFPITAVQVCSSSIPACTRCTKHALGAPVAVLERLV
jgi:hypothetical protein